VTKERLKTDCFVGLFLLTNILFGYPVMTLFNIDGFAFCIPLFYFFLFVSWLVVIGLIILCTRVDKESDIKKRLNLKKIKVLKNKF
jgi:hypothetical protein